MKSRLAVLLALALLAPACGSSGVFRIGQATSRADQRVVEQLVCSGREGEARTYVEDRGGSRAEIVERVERARAKCPAGGVK